MVRYFLILVPLSLLCWHETGPSQRPEIIEFGEWRSEFEILSAKSLVPDREEQWVRELELGLPGKRLVDRQCIAEHLPTRILPKLLVGDSSRCSFEQARLQDGRIAGVVSCPSGSDKVDTTVTLDGRYTSRSVTLIATYTIDGIIAVELRGIHRREGACK